MITLEALATFFPTNHRTYKNSFDFRFVTKKEVSLTLKLLNSNKTSGLSDIPSWALKDGFLFLVDPIKLLFNQFLAEGNFPEDLKNAVDTQIFKKEKTLCLRITDQYQLQTH